VYITRIVWCQSQTWFNCLSAHLLCAITVVLFKLKSLFAFGNLYFRIAEGIVRHMKTIIKPGSVELKTVAEIDTFLTADDNCVLGKLLVNNQTINISVFL